MSAFALGGANPEGSDPFVTPRGNARLGAVVVVVGCGAVVVLVVGEVVRDVDVVDVADVVDGDVVAEPDVALVWGAVVVVVLLACPW